MVCFNNTVYLPDCSENESHTNKGNVVWGKCYDEPNWNHCELASQVDGLPAYTVSQSRE